MAKLRTPIFLLALGVILVIVLVERGLVSPATVKSYVPAFLHGEPPAIDLQQLDFFTPEQQEKLADLQDENQGEMDRLTPELAGYGVTALHYVDATLLFTLALMTLGLLVGEAVQAKIQGLLTLLFAIGLTLLAVITALAVWGKLLTMVTLLLAFPFGTLTYLAVYGDFAVGAVGATLNLLLALKIGFVLLLLLAHQGFVKNLGLVIFVLVAFVANIGVSLIFGLVPGILGSIADAVAALVAIALSVILALVLAGGGVVSLVTALKG